MKLPKYFRSVIPSVRIFAVAIIAIATVANVATAVNRSWNSSSSGDWSDAGDWSPNGVPMFGDAVLIGNFFVAQNDTVTLDQNSSVAEVHITDGMNLRTDGFTLFVSGDTFVSGSNSVGNTTFHSDLILDRGVGLDDYDTDNLTVTDDARVRLDDGAILEVDELLTVDSDSSLRGEGIIRLGGAGLVYRNDGVLDPTTGGLTINVTGGGQIDLDGSSGNGLLFLTAGKTDGSAFDNLTINGGTLADPFGGEIGIVANAFLAMNLTAPWSVSSGGEINLYGSPGHPGPAIINGADVSIGGQVNVTGTDAHGRIDADATFTSFADVAINVGDRLEMNGNTTVEGGQFSLEENGELDFDGPTTIEGGTFNTHSNLSADGFVNFSGPTDWDGNVTINGIARQNGDADVVGATMIQAGILDMDGGGGTSWNVGNKLVVNADGVDSRISNSFDGVLNIGGGFAPEMIINLSDPADHWTMAGEMNLSNLGFVPFPVNRVAGSRMRVTGQLNVAHRVRVSAPTTFDNSSETNLLLDTARLSMSGAFDVRPGATFNGVGTLINESDEGMTLEDGVSLDLVGLVNAGLLEVGDSLGVADVDRFENTDEGTWLVEIGGHVAGTEHDLLVVTDGATLLDGLIEVDLIDAGGGLFLPEIGGQFTVLTSVADISGIFSNEPITLADGKQFQWSVIYNPHEVILELANISVPEPSALVLAIFGIAGIIARRRSN